MTWQALGHGGFFESDQNAMQRGKRRMEGIRNHLKERTSRKQSVLLNKVLLGEKNDKKKKKKKKIPELENKPMANVGMKKNE